MKKWFLLTWLVVIASSCGSLEPMTAATSTRGAGGSEETGGAGGSGGGGIEPITLGPTPYKSFADSPFAKGTPTGYFHLEDFENNLLDTPGVTSPAGGVCSTFGLPQLIDSVDGDDGNPSNDDCMSCDGYFDPSGPQGVEYVFDASVLGGKLPTHAGIVFTDGGPGSDVVFTAFDADGNELGTIVAKGVADETVYPSFDEDRFFGIIAPSGVQRIKLTASTGGIEADHLQYGAF